MQTLFQVFAVVLFPAAVVLALLMLARRVERGRAEAITRQIQLTDAIHRELGAVVAPFVTRGRRGRWRVSIAVPLERPALVGAVLGVVRGAFPGRFDLVLTPRESPARPETRELGRARERRSPSWA
jgi:hypothetical protein